MLNVQTAIKLIIVKVIHTVIWICFNIVILYMLYAAIVNKLDWRLWAGYGIIMGEGIILFAFNYVCPLTIIAHKYSRSAKDNFDIYLPNGLARYNKLIYTGILIVISIITIFRLFGN